MQCCMLDENIVSVSFDAVEPQAVTTVVRQHDKNELVQQQRHKIVNLAPIVMTLSLGQLKVMTIDKNLSFMKYEQKMSLLRESDKELNTD